LYLITCSAAAGWEEEGEQPPAIKTRANIHKIKNNTLLLNFTKITPCLSVFYGLFSLFCEFPFLTRKLICKILSQLEGFFGTFKNQSLWVKQLTEKQISFQQVPKRTNIG
jgi:hypothetical protein